MSDDLEARLMTRINDNQARLLERLDGIEKQLDDVDLALTSLTELARVTHTLLLGVSHHVTNLLLLDLPDRITNLETQP
jgi:hypothetical protein